MSFSYNDKVLENRTWNNYVQQNSMKNKNNYNTSGNRIYSVNTRVEKETLNIDNNIDRSIKRNPYIKGESNIDRIDIIDTKNIDNKKIKQDIKKNKFNKYQIY